RARDDGEAVGTAVPTASPPPGAPLDHRDPEISGSHTRIGPAPRFAEAKYGIARQTFSVPGAGSGVEVEYDLLRSAAAADGAAAAAPGRCTATTPTGSSIGRSTRGVSAMMHAW